MVSTTALMAGKSRSRSAATGAEGCRKISTAAANPDVSYPLARGDKLGFTTENEKAYAVAGPHKDEIKRSKVYYWKMQKE